MSYSNIISFFHLHLCLLNRSDVSGCREADLSHVASISVPLLSRPASTRMLVLGQECQKRAYVPYWNTSQCDC